MSAHNNTFIDAYGLELNDELAANYGEPAQQPSANVGDSASPREDVPAQRTYRFDAVGRRQTLRGPHFDMRRVATETEAAANETDSFDMNVIDVGAAWAPTPAPSAPSIEESVTEEHVAPLAAQPKVEQEINVVTKPHDSFDIEPSFKIVPDTTANAEAKVQVPAVTIAVQPEVVTTPKPQAPAPIINNQAIKPAVAEEPATIKEAAPAVEPTEQSVAESPASDIAESTDVAAAPTSSEFAPVWEVDSFNWPDEIEQLFKAQTEYFDYAGKKLVSASREGLQILAITSTRAGEGSTTLAMCLARAAAGAGARVGLIDGNIERSELGEKLGVDFASGWQSAAVSDEPLGEAAITGLEEGITLFPSSSEPVAGIDSLADVRVGDIIKTAASNYDLLIIDAGTGDLGNNVRLLDAAMVVRDVRLTSEDETLAVASALRHCGVKAVGIAENFGSSHPQRAAA